MTPPGPRPKSNKVKQLQGNPGKRRLDDDPAQFEEGMPEAPAHLHGDALERYYHHCKVLSNARALAEGDRDVIARLAWLGNEINEQTLKLESEPRIMETQRGGPTLNPRARYVRDLIKEERALLVEIGLTPSARNRVKALTRRADPTSPEEAKQLELADNLFRPARIDIARRKK